MIYFIWSLLNLGALVWFLFIAFSVLKSVRDNLGTLSAVIFVVCCLSFIKGSVTNQQQEMKANPNVKDQTVDIEQVKNEMFFHIDLMYFNLKDTSAQNTMYGSSYKSGFVIGHEWLPVITKVYKKAEVIQYEASGIHEWKLLGLTLYSEPQQFQGTIKVK